MCAASQIDLHPESESPGHLPVMPVEVMEWLAPEGGGWFVDATFGGGGHSRLLLQANDGVRVWGLDRDPEAATRADKLAADFNGRFTFYRTDFSGTGAFPKGGVTGVLFDLGVSSFQFDEARRGFSFRADAPLDMRMDPTQGRSAAEFLEGSSEEELIEAVRDFGEERYWRRVVHAIQSARGSGVLATTLGLAGVVRAVIPAAKPGIDPATRTFQGVRVAVNRELRAIEEALPAAFECLEEGGRLVVISFHSLEDRIVKRLFRRWAGRPEHSRDWRSQDERQCRGILPFNRPLRPSALEVQRNPRSRSARLRVIIKKEIPA